MKNNFKLSIVPFILVFAAILIAIPSCSSSKSGCPANDQAQVKTNKKGELPSKRGKSSLFPKDVKKSVGVK